MKRVGYTQNGVIRMARYIDIDKFKKWATVYVDFCGDKDCIEEGIICDECYYEHGGAEDVAPVVHSSWRKLYGYSKCNNCGQRSTIQTNYCPNCGAKMDIE